MTRENGRWIYSRYGYKGCDSWICSICRSRSISRDYNFCPRCGADMRGKKTKYEQLSLGLEEK